MGGLKINLLHADVAALPAEARSFLGAHHIVGVLGALRLRHMHHTILA